MLQLDIDYVGVGEQVKGLIRVNKFQVKWWFKWHLFLLDT